MPTTSSPDRLARAAASAGLPDTTAADRATWLRAVADALDSATDELVERASAETHLPDARLRGEVARTTGQLRLFGDAVSEGSYLEATIDHADSASSPPRPDLRRMLVPLGPVAVFAASNFPFAFSVAGGDTASALAAGCPVIVKAHEGHPATSVLTADIVASALADSGAPAGTFGMLTSREDGIELVQHPAVTAAAFTGSVRGGRALFDLAAARPDPIPFYGELGSINPVVITERAVRARGDELTKGLVESFTLGRGQFCTKPGVVFVPRGSGFTEALAEVTPGGSGGPLLTDSIAQGFVNGLREIAADSDLRVIQGRSDQTADVATPVIVATSAAQVRQRPEALLEEHFGPLVLVVEYDHDELESTIKTLPGSLTGTIHAEPGEDVSGLATLLGQRVGRLLFAGWPTGVAVSWAQHHGGPWPATTSLHTSVGTTALRRFLRPIAYQDAPQELLPDALLDSNPLVIPRRIDGRLVLPR